MIKAMIHTIRNTPSWLFWTVMAIIGLLIIIFNDAFGEVEPFLYFASIYFLVLIVASIRWLFVQIKSIIALKRDKAKMEMLHLKSQVNPHFFFNTLNNLYGLVDKNPKQAQELILKLSEMMRYSIYEGQNEWVSLEEEIAYLNNYVQLHKNRYHKKVTIDIKTSMDKPGYKIMPLLLILLVENAFKHGVEKLRNNAMVNIALHARDDQIHFSIVNNFDHEDCNDQSSGIGLTNLKRRLEIGYQKNFKFETTQVGENFKAELSLLKV